MALDRIITIEQPVISRDSYGSVVTNYEPLAQVWAEKMAGQRGRKVYTRFRRHCGNPRGYLANPLHARSHRANARGGR